MPHVTVLVDASRSERRLAVLFRLHPGDRERIVGKHKVVAPFLGDLEVPLPSRMFVSANGARITVVADATGVSGQMLHGDVPPWKVGAPPCPGALGEPLA